MRLRMFARYIITLICVFTILLAIMPFGKTIAPTSKLNMAYIYSGQPSSYVDYVDATKGAINAISPDFFNLNTDGRLQLTPKVTIDLVNEMHKRNIKVIPFLSNHWDRDLGRSAFKNRWELAQQIADAINTYNLDGINVDIENMTEVDRSDYVDFVRILRGILPQEKTISVAVCSNIKDSNTGWAGSYDYTALSTYSDFIMIMAYDEHYRGGPEGPVAGADFVEASIQYALTKVPKEKIVLGIPFYGRYWKQGESYGGHGIDMTTAEKLIHKYNGSVVFDSNSKSAKAFVTVKPGGTLPVVGYRQLTPGNYVIWYENEASIKHKLSLVHKYGLMGTASWSLNQETPSTWDYYELWLNGYFFEDIIRHWAQESIVNSIDRGWMKGTSGVSFSPNIPLTRAQAAVVMTRVLGLQTIQIDSPFTDTSGHWAEKEINTVWQHGILLGKGNNIFAPDEAVTREQMAVILDRVLTGLEPANNNHSPYNDIHPIQNGWSYDAIIKMTHNEIFNGYADGLFHPSDELSRAQMAALLQRINHYLN